MRIMSAIHPTMNQKRVLAKIVASPTPTVAAAQIKSDINIVYARNMLMKLGIITVTDTEAALTDRGTQIATEENIIDPSGQLTQTGRELAFTNSRGQQDTDQTSSADNTMPPADDMMPPADDMMPPAGNVKLESIRSGSLLEQILS